MIIRVENVSKKYWITRGWSAKQEVMAVDNISFAIQSGERVGFIGPNGAGKSTTIKMLSGIMEPTAGKVSVLDLNPIKNRKKLSYQTSVIFGQKSQLSSHLSAHDNFSLIASIYDIEKKQYQERLAYLAKQFEVCDFIKTPIRQLSLGQRMRCEVIAALLHQPKIVFLDEPTIGLDIITKQSFRELLMKMNQVEGTTLLVTSHDLADIEKLCERVIIIMNGRIVFDDRISRLKELSQCENKTLKVRFTGSYPKELIQESEIIKSDAYELVIKISSLSELPSKISLLQAYVQIMDIEIASLPLEDIVASIYSHGSIMNS